MMWITHERFLKSRTLDYKDMLYIHTHIHTPAFDGEEKRKGAICFATTIIH